jgi:MerR family transcriptional regulator, copper efflux regulator
MTKLDEFVTISEASKLLGVCHNTIRSWDRAGKIPVYRSPLSGYRLFKRTDLEEILRQVEQSGRNPTGWRRPNKPK